ncbi:MAG: hypothetical protein JSW50_07445, partial [Candidatus Latescibacterota bacterium]
VLGGAFLLRWFTQSGVFPHRVGVVVGMIYALLWIAVADLGARRGQRHSAVFHGFTGVFIALPLLVEATTKFHYLTPMLSAILLAAVIILGLLVAGRRNLRILAWGVTLPAAPLAFVLSAKTQVTTPFLLSLLLLGFATLWLGYLRRWHGLATLVAGAVNLGLALVIMEQIMMSKRVPAGPMANLWEILSLLFGLIALYFGSYCFRVFKRKRTITPLEIGQTLVVALIGLGGAAMVINANERSMVPLGIFCVVLSIANYTAAYGLLPRRDPNRRNFLFYTLLALAMALLGCEMLLDRSTAAIVYAVIALMAGALAHRITSPILFLHGSIYLIAAIIGSGLPSAAFHGFANSSIQLNEWIRVPVLFALILTAVYPWFPRPHVRKTDQFLGRRAVELIMFISVFAWGSFFVSLMAQFVPLTEETETYRRVLASVRTGVIALSAVVIAWFSSRTRFGNLAWLVYTILFLGAIKLIIQDITAGGTVTLFLSFGFYGGALILAPRMLHRSASRKISG